MANEVKGLKKLRNPGGAAKRQGNWSGPNKKASARAKVRADAFDRFIKNLPSTLNAAGFHKPGSMNVRNQS